MKIFDTIAAISTPLGKGGVAVIRISGGDALEVADRVFERKNGAKLSCAEPNRMVYGNIYENLPDGSRTCIDDGMAVYFKAPHSFTGEDTVEISCHGGSFVSRCVLSAILCAGARHAEAGEFTRRAFLVGKLDLTEAEGLGNLLEAKNINQLHIARAGMSGALSDRTSPLYDNLKALLGSIYAKIDFPDEDLAEMNPAEMLESLKRTLSSTERLASTYRTGRAVNEGIKTVICGPANAGKSSVYNRLVGYDSAIVTDIEGTTRDILQETITLGRATLRIHDTAGLRSTEDTVESIGIERARAEISSSELVLAVFDGARPLSPSDKELIGELSALNASTVALINKSDIASDIPLSAFEGFDHTLVVSAKDGKGFDELARIVDTLFIDGDIDLRSDAVVADARQYASLLRAADSLRSSIAAISEGTPLDLCCIDVESAMQAIGELEGREVGEEIVAEIFSKFCVGK